METPSGGKGLIPKQLVMLSPEAGGKTFLTDRETRNQATVSQFKGQLEKNAVW